MWGCYLGPPGQCARGVARQVLSMSDIESRPGARQERLGLARRIRVLITDDHPIVLSGIKAVLSSQPWVEIVAEARSGEEAFQKACALKPDVVLLDIRMPGIGGIRSAEQILEHCPNTHVLALTVQGDTGTLRAILAAGASGCILKNADSANLVHAITAVCQGKKYIDPSFSEGLADLLGPANRVPHPGGPLSSRERQVLLLIARGYTNEQAGQELGLSVKTVETYRSRLSQKLGLESRADIVHYALEHGLLTP